MKKFLTVLLVIAVMFTFSFSSAFAAGTDNFKVTEAKAEADAVVATYSINDYTGAALVSFTSALYDYQGKVLDSKSVTQIQNALASFTDAVKVLPKTDKALNALRESYADKLADYEYAINFALSCETGTMTNVSYLKANNVTPTDVFAKCETEAEMKALYDSHKGKIDKEAVKVVAWYSTSIATDAYKQENVAKIRSKYAGLPTANYSYGTVAKIGALCDEAVAKVNAATTVEEVDAVMDEYLGTGETYPVFKGSGLKLSSESYGKITDLIENGVRSGDTITIYTVQDAADLVEVIETYYLNNEEVVNGKWDEVAAIYYAAQKAAVGSTWGSATDAANKEFNTNLSLNNVASATDTLKSCLRLATEQSTLTNLDLVQKLDSLGYDTPAKLLASVTDVYSASKAAKAKTALVNYIESVAVANTLAEVRALEDELAATLKAIPTKANEAEDEAIAEAKEYVRVYKETAMENVYFTDDVLTAIDVLYNAAIAKLDAGFYANPEIIKAASITSFMESNTNDAITVLFTLLKPVTNTDYGEAYPTVASKTNQRVAKASSSDLFKGYYDAKIKANYGGFTSNVFDAGTFYEDPNASAFVESNQSIADRYLGWYNSRLTNNIWGLDVVTAQYNELVAQLDKLPLASAKKFEKDYSKLETALKAMADNPATGIAADKSRITDAKAAMTALFGTPTDNFYNEGAIPSRWALENVDGWTADQIEVAYTAYRTIVDYQYAYDLAYEDPDSLVGIASIEKIWSRLKVVMTEDVDEYFADQGKLGGTPVTVGYGYYTAADKAAIAKQIVATDNAMAAATTAAAKAAAAQAGIDAILAYVPTYVKISAEDYADLLAAAKANAQKFFATYEGKTFVSVANDGFQLRDEIMAGSAFDVKAAIANLKAVARSVKTSKGNIKVTVVADTTALKTAGYSVEYKFYRSTKSNKNYKAMITKKANTYTNTTGKKGVKYFYKAKLVVKDAAGNTVGTTALTQCKYACRTK